MLKVVVGSGDDGVPEIAPDKVSRDNPVGSVGATVYVIGAEPPLTTTGVKVEAELPEVRVLDPIAVLEVIGCNVTPKIRFAVAVSPLASVPVKT